MLELKGKYNSAKVFTDVIGESAVAQIIELCCQPMSEGAQIRIMPDVHAGKGCTVGTTMTIRDKVIPNLVGVDIGCGMETVMLGAGTGSDPLPALPILTNGDIRESRNIPPTCMMRNKP